MSNKQIVEVLNYLDEALDWNVKLVCVSNTSDQIDICKNISEKIWEAKDILNNVLYGQ